VTLQGTFGEVFPGTRMHWYWQQKTIETKHYIHPEHKTQTEKNLP